MPPMESDLRNQKAVLWDATGAIDDYGRPVVEAPENVWVRWELRNIQVVDRQGNLVGLDGEVVVDRKVGIGSQMWLAPDQSANSDTATEQWYGTGSAGDDSEVMEVVTYSDIPDIKGRHHRREVGIRRYRDQPST
jgi:hypothetical protein